MRPLLSSRPYAVRRLSRVDTSALGFVAPSTGRNRGSRPHDWSKRFCTFAALIAKPSSGAWQDPQVRPFVPRDWKNGFFVSRSAPSRVEYVAWWPFAFLNGCKFTTGFCLAVVL